jgi:hypothetical protein
MPDSPELLVYRALAARHEEWCPDAADVQVFQAAKIAVQTLEQHGEFVVWLRCPDCGREQEGTG